MSNRSIQRLALLDCALFAAMPVAEQDCVLDLAGRLARLLTRLATDHGSVTPEGVCIGFKLPQRDIGTQVASSRESLNKQLQVWRDAGWLSLDHGYITLRDLSQLKRLNDPG